MGMNCEKSKARNQMTMALSLIFKCHSQKKQEKKWSLKFRIFKPFIGSERDRYASECTCVSFEKINRLERTVGTAFSFY